MKIIQTNTNNYSSRSASSSIEHIIIHHTAMNNIDSVISWLKNPISQVSAHYVIDKNGDIYQMVAEDKKAWHAGISHWRGDNNLNHNSIGIELVNSGYEPFDEHQINSLIELCKVIKNRYQIDDRNIIGHSDVAPNRKIDPSIHFDWQKLADENLGIMSAIQIESPKAMLHYGFESDAIADLKNDLIDFGYQINNYNSNRYDIELDYVVKAFKRHYCQETYDMEGWDELANARLHDLLDTLAKPIANNNEVLDA